MPGKPGAWDLKAIREWRDAGKPEFVIDGINADDCLDAIEQIGNQILSEDDLLRQALREYSRDERRAVTIELIHYMVDVFADLSGMQRKAVFERLGVMPEFENYPAVLAALKQRLGIEEK